MTASKLPSHKVGLTIAHNEHKNYYQSIEKYIKDNDYYSNFSNEEYKKCIETDNIWEIQWYPLTPIGFYIVFASTLQKACELACSVKIDDIGTYEHHVEIDIDEKYNNEI